MSELPVRSSSEGARFNSPGQRPGSAGPDWPLQRVAEGHHCSASNYQTGDEHRRRTRKGDILRFCLIETFMEK